MLGAMKADTQAHAYAWPALLTLLTNKGDIVVVLKFWIIQHLNVLNSNIGPKNKG